jgi:hypothetical protein
LDLPTRTKQQKAESESYAILLYKLRRLGIFRNLTENDYGIDFEVELVSNESVTGRYFKAQVKSAENLNVRVSDGVPTVGGIKQSTLAYWCELSHRTHVVAYAVDLANEAIYVSRPLFWQATRLMDGSDASKSIEFLPVDKRIDQDKLVEFLSVANALSPSVPDTIYALTIALRYLKQFLELRVDAFHNDPGTELDHPEVLRAFLEVCSILLAWRNDDVPLPKEDRKSMYSFELWGRKWDPHSTEITCWSALAPMKALLPMLVTRLQEFRELVLAGAYYWSFKNPQFLELLHDAPLPAATDDKTLDDWGYKYDQVVPRQVEPAWMLIRRVREASKREQAAASTKRAKPKKRKRAAPRKHRTATGRR